jgi:hypothetical protein
MLHPSEFKRNPPLNSFVSGGGFFTIGLAAPDETVCALAVQAINEKEKAISRFENIFRIMAGYVDYLTPLLWGISYKISGSET